MKEMAPKVLADPDLGPKMRRNLEEMLAAGESGDIKRWAHAGAASCCPGPAALCVHPTTTTLPEPLCGLDPGTALCGGACPAAQVCAPATPQATAAAPCACRTAECATATDCHGPLPQFCLTCGCAHWACEAGRCVVEVCSPTPG